MTDIALLRRTAHYIGGSWVDPAESHSPLVVTDASDGSTLGTVPDGSAADVDRAVDAARAAFPAWAALSPSERSGALLRVRDALAERAADASRIISLEVGTTARIADAVQVGLPLKTLAGFADAALHISEDQQLGNSTVAREPAGVVGAITPWNYPLHQLVGKAGGALAAGCTVVCKPAGVAPLSAFILADAIAAAGLPAGVFNLVSGSGSVVGTALARHPGIDVLSFTGSTAVGAEIAAAAATNITRVALELGGKSASVILDDVELERAVKTSVNNAFLNSGQTCSAWTRLVVPRAAQERVIEIAISVAEKLTVGHPLDPATRLGPLASAEQQSSVLDYIAKGEQEARLVFGGSSAPEGFAEGYYVRPTIFADVDNRSQIAQQEIFGPVLCIIPHDGDDDAIRIANDSAYGLAGGVWCADEGRALAAARAIRTGQVDINGGAFNPIAPFGGFKHSGIGREFGLLGVEEFTELKAIQR
ncbi:MAG: aldehyde dehydrogenase [Subtercola sp.]|nr:aldehyde dehydrogenase [Subtercola sp.]